jgi:chromosome condensin MukBEF ATPase and DNA-binding subunit MukB
VVAPKRVKLEEAQEALQEKRASLAADQAKLLELNLCLDHLQKGYEEKLQQKEELKKKVGSVK